MYKSDSDDQDDGGGGGGWGEGWGWGESLRWEHGLSGMNEGALGSTPYGENPASDWDISSEFDSRINSDNKIESTRFRLREPTLALPKPTPLGLLEGARLKLGGPPERRRPTGATRGGTKCPTKR
jgi:hypothetical protein